MPAINPQILSWARETAGLSVEAAAAKLVLGNARGRTGAERLLALEGGGDAPSRPMLLKMAKLYRRPLLVFYMKEPPPRGNRGEDFRSLPTRDLAHQPLLDTLVRDVRARQTMVRATLNEEEETKPLTFVGSMSMNDGVGAVLVSLRQAVNLDLATFRAQGSPDAAFGLLRSKVEAMGVFVLLMGNLGSHHTALDVSVFRGFAVADQIAPFIVINDQDAKAAWSFTLLHELAHLWLGATGVSGAMSDSAVEQFCNDVASNFLLPGHELDLLRERVFTDRHDVAALIGQFAEERLLSRALVTYRLFRANAISEALWRDLTAQFRDEWRRSRELIRERNREQDGGPDYYVVRRHKLGPALLRFVARNVDSGAITPTKAAKILSVKPRSVATLLGGLIPDLGRAA